MRGRGWWVGLCLWVREVGELVGVAMMCPHARLGVGFDGWGL